MAAHRVWKIRIYDDQSDVFVLYGTSHRAVLSQAASWARKHYWDYISNEEELNSVSCEEVQQLSGLDLLKRVERYWKIQFADIDVFPPDAKEIEKEPAWQNPPHT